MNDDAFEKKLESLAGSLPRPDPTPQWKADILARARREAATPAASALPRRALPPRWLMAAWCTAWALIVLMHVTTPADHSVAGTSTPLATAMPKSGKASALRGDAPTTLTLLAFHRELSASSISTYDTP
jgi:hypothetical protein